MQENPDKVACLLDWCFTQGIRIDPRLEIKENGEAGISVFSRGGYISSTTTVVHIPKPAVLSVKSSSKSEHIAAEPYGHGAHLALALAVYIELLKGRDSHWFGYLQSLPKEPVALALFWGVGVGITDTPRDVSEVNNQSATGGCFLDGQQAMTWITGTELEKELRGSAETGQTLLDVRDYYVAIAKPLILRLFGQSVSLEGFYHAYSLVSSRAFLVDAYHGLAMVPIADASLPRDVPLLPLYWAIPALILHSFNHTQENHVHLESDFDVCTVCGSFDECSHDREEDSPESRCLSASTFGKAMAKSISATSRPDGFYEMVSNAPILPHSEVFNTYGEKLTNAQLLVRYGFALDSNENDCITWDWDDLWTFAATILYDEPRDTSESSGCVDDVMQLYSQAINLWPSESWVWDETSVVFNPEPATAANAIIKGGGWGGSPKRHTDQAADAIVLCLNDDGRISHHLWLYCAVLGHQCVAIDGGVEEIVGQLREIAALLMQIEKEIALEGSSSDDSDRDYGAARQQGGARRQPFCYPPTPILEVASQTIRTVLCLCHSRSQRIGKGDLWTAFEIGEELDRVPPHMTRTRQAMVEALSEKSLLESVEATWSHMGQRLNSVTLDQNFNKS